MHHLDRDPGLMALFRALGPDLTVTSYAFNLRLPGGPNPDQALMNAVNETIFRALSLEAGHPGEIPSAPMFVTSTMLEGPGTEAMVASLASRAGVVPVAGMGLRVLISTVQNPWLTETARGNFLPELMQVLHATATDAVRSVAARHGVDFGVSPPVSLCRGDFGGVRAWFIWDMGTTRMCRRSPIRRISTPSS